MGIGGEAKGEEGAWGVIISPFALLAEKGRRGTQICLNKRSVVFASKMATARQFMKAFNT